MYKVTVTRKDGTVRTYKSTFRCDDVRMHNLPSTLRNEYFPYASGQTLIHEHVGATITHEPLDGRTKEAKTLKYYSVSSLLDKDV